ncbi:MAG: hydrogenase expression/formation protein HypE [Actinobacteria bacterium]|nr:hydrogenase expression/formation protein HypE [Actinomycetota bacterium]
MDKIEEFIQLSHGDGGIKTGELIEKTILGHLKNKILEKLEDSAILELNGTKIAFTTDSFVVDPVFFPGGDIGKLSVCGTINDLATTGCRPVALSLSFIMEEGFPLTDFKKILASIKETADESGVNIVTGDTKVVGKGNADSIFINTSGIGLVDYKKEFSPRLIKPGDKIIINGPIADHGAAIMSCRKGFNFKSGIKSDCAPLSAMVMDMIKVSDSIHCLRDATRGGLATILLELAKSSGTRINIFEDNIPLRKEVRGLCEFLGLDPLYMANEGKMVAFVGQKDASRVIEAISANKYGKGSSIIGEVAGKDDEGPVILNTAIGTTRILDRYYSEQLPRIC